MIDLADIFSIKVARKASKARSYKVTWPTGGEWTFDRHDLDVPEFRDGDQTGLTHCYDSLRDAIADLRAMGCTVVQL